MISVSSFARPLSQSSTVPMRLQVKNDVSSSLLPRSIDSNFPSLSPETFLHRVSSPLVTSSPFQPNPSCLVFELSGFLLLGILRPTLSPVKVARVSGSDVLITLVASRSDLIFSQVGLGPFSLPLRPICRIGVPKRLLQKPRSDPNFLLLSFSIILSRFMSSIDCGRQLEHTLSLLLCWFKIYLRTLPLETHISFFHGCKSLEKSGIMIPPPRSGDYRILFKLSSLLHLSIESIQSFLLLSIIRDLPKDSTRVMKMGIMIPLISSGYSPSCLNALYAFHVAEP